MSHQPRMRPEFVEPLAMDPGAFYGTLQQRLTQEGATCRGRVFDGGAILRVREREEHIWSPALHLFVERQSAGEGWEVRGRFSPSSPVWMFFMFIYLGLLCVGVCAACWGGVQVFMGEAPWAFWGVPLVVALAAFTYGAAFIGQGLGAEDMHELRSVVEGAARTQTAGTDSR